jgi:hypothetical protein
MRILYLRRDLKNIEISLQVKMKRMKAVVLVRNKL